MKVSVVQSVTDKYMVQGPSHGFVFYCRNDLNVNESWSMPINTGHHAAAIRNQVLDALTILTYKFSVLPDHWRRPCYLQDKTGSSANTRLTWKHAHLSKIFSNMRFST